MNLIETEIKKRKGIPKSNLGIMHEVTSDEEDENNTPIYNIQTPDFYNDDNENDLDLPTSNKQVSLNQQL